MYSHGLATIALSEDFGLTADSKVGQAAQAAVNFTLKAQNPTTAAGATLRVSPATPPWSAGN